LAPRVTEPVPELFRAPIVWLAPIANVAPVEMVTFANDPSDEAAFEFNIPPVMPTAVPSTRLVAFVPMVRVPDPAFVIVRAIPPSFNAPNVRFAVVGLKVALPVSVVAPNCKA